MLNGLQFSDVEWVCGKCGDFLDMSRENPQSVWVMEFCFKEYGRCVGCMDDVPGWLDDD